MKNGVPFYPNTKDNAHCAPAVFKALIEYFCHEKLSWDEMDKLGQSVYGKGTWTIPYHLKLASCGVDVQVIEAFDYEAFAKNGREYLESLGEKGQFYINHSNWEKALSLAESFVKAVHHTDQGASIDEIDNLISRGYLVGVELNSRKLNNQEGFMLHYVLIKQKIGDKYLINDPGGPKENFENRLVEKSKFIEAIGGKQAKYEVAAFRKI
jgi:hypothetical protein